ncbi:hypothetical protein DYB37_010114 [Aphanomyces astaci]|uniref:AB hydrolase-1 domain-containing protein n=1 Tax=Aphanomyces astaci TaxID=112090 RepID=A0A3R7ARE5_APHAT|nr:hypothetical protein DYB35_008360 [Aphanomyces astaci]RHZ14833.1 hypothetical protein DYB37_010114 [Aphanomyces astaci]
MPAIVAPLVKAAAELVMKRRRASIGFSRRFLYAGWYKWAYLDSKARPNISTESELHQPTVVLVHGFSSDKDAWLPIAKYLIHQGYRVVMPDLPGHGATTPVCSSHNYGVDAQVANLLSFLSALQAATRPPLRSNRATPTPIHLVGYSMGGLIAGLFAATFPRLVRTLTLLCPAGISMPTPSPVVALFDDTGLRLMEASTVQHMDDLLRYAQGPTTTKLKRQNSRVVVHMYAKIQAARRDVVSKIFDDLEPERSTLEDQLHRIEADTLVLWGAQDQILDVSCAHQVRSKGFRTIVVEGCGHDITQVRPQLCATHINRMISRDIRRSTTRGVDLSQSACTSYSTTMDSASTLDADFMEVSPWDY